MSKKLPEVLGSISSHTDKLLDLISGQKRCMLFGMSDLYTGSNSTMHLCECPVASRTASNVLIYLIVLPSLYLCLQAGYSSSSSSHAGLDGRQAAVHATIKAAQEHTTQTGVPCYSVSAVMDADVVEGSPVAHREQLPAREAWRVARVASVAVPPSR